MPRSSKAQPATRPAKATTKAGAKATKPPTKAMKAKPPAPKKAPAKKGAPVKKAALPRKAVPVKAAPVKKAPAKKAPAKKAPAKKAPAKAPAKVAKAPAKVAAKPVPKPVKAPAKVAPVKAAPKPVVPVKKKPVVLDKFLLGQRELLQGEKVTYTRQAEALRLEAEQLAQEMEPGDIQFDEESGEGGTMNVERERDLALSAQARQSVEEIDRALAKIVLGTYGICEGCGKPIPRDRLKALPQASLCVACKSGGLSARR